MASIHLQNVSKSYGAHVAIADLSLDIADKEFVVLVGPSGCGKSTTLRMIAGLEEVTGGDLLFDSTCVNDTSPADRNVAMVFQNYALYPHMSVERNLSFGLQNLSMPKDEIARRVADAAKTLGLEPLLKRKPAQLSGGQRQRVAMGRAIVRHPAVFLFDEPLSNLDAMLRSEMRTAIKRLHKTVDTTVVYVTHDQVEAMTLADRLVVMRDGVIEQVGRPQEVFDRPANVFVAGFIGSPRANLIEGYIKRDGDVAIFHTTNFHTTDIHTKDAHFQLPLTGAGYDRLADGMQVTLGLRPDDVTPVAASSVKNAIQHSGGVVSFVEPLGAESYLLVSTGGVEIMAKAVGRNAPNVGDAITLSVNPDMILLFDGNTGLRIEQGVSA